MKFIKLLFVVVGATALLGAFVSSASARNLSISSQTNTVLWRAARFAGGIGGAVECEIKASGSFHARTIAKVVALVGYITEATFLRCARGSATINQASLPWHRRYSSFVGTLPNITGESETFSGLEWTVREPSGITCTVTGATAAGTFAVSSGTVTRAAISGTSRCGGFFTGSLGGEETNATNGSGVRLTVTLI